MKKTMILSVFAAVFCVVVQAQEPDKLEVRPLFQLHKTHFQLSPNVRFGFAGWYVRPDVTREKVPVFTVGGVALDFGPRNKPTNWVEFMAGSRINGKGEEAMAINIRNYNTIGNYGVYDELIVIPQNAVIIPFTFTRNFSWKFLKYGFGFDGEFNSVRPDRMLDLDGRAGPLAEISAFNLRLAATYMLGRPHEVFRIYMKARI